MSTPFDANSTIPANLTGNFTPQQRLAYNLKNLILEYNAQVQGEDYVELPLDDPSAAIGPAQPRRPLDVYRSSPGQKDLDLELLQQAHGGHWGEHPEFTIRDWETDVSGHLTMLGYWDWLEAELLAAEADEPGPTYDVWQAAMLTNSPGAGLSIPFGEWEHVASYCCSEDWDGEGARNYAHKTAKAMRKRFTGLVAVRLATAGMPPKPRPAMLEEQPTRDAGS